MNRLQRSLFNLTSKPLIPSRRFSTQGSNVPPPPKAKYLPAVAVLSVLSAGILYVKSQKGELKPSLLAKRNKGIDYQLVYNSIASLLEDLDYDDGSYAPLFLRLAWHAAGTYDKVTKTGGSCGATMRFNPESAHPANAGLNIARDKLELVKQKFGDQLTYSDLWSLAGVVAVQETGGPVVKWRPGRSDAISSTECTPDGRLPDASQGEKHVRDIFYRMGFTDAEIVALIGAHGLGRCHKERSGYDGPWTFTPTSFSNNFYKLLLNESWNVRKWDGEKQYQDKASKSLMMLPADMAFLWDKGFKKYVVTYAEDEKKFFNDFALAFQKLEELGVEFKEGVEERTFERAN